MGQEPFGAVLRRHRLLANLTQERLAERAGVSATGIAALEAGRRRAPRLSTVSLLVAALGGGDELRRELTAAATAADAEREGAHASPAERAPSPTTQLVGYAWRYGFVGRRAELERIREAIAAGARVVLISGEAGAGKTRLADELARHLLPPRRVLWGRCTPERLGAYEPFIEPVRRLLGDGQVGGPGRRELARLLPGHDGPTGPTRTDPGVEQRLLFDAVAELLAGLGPTLLVIDDVQWADAATLALLRHLGAADLPVVVVGTIRSTELTPRTAGALAELRRWARVERVELGGLDDAALATLIAEVSGGQPSASLVASVLAATDGNPLYVEELTEHLLAHARDDRAIGGAVPAGVQATIGQRVGELAPGAQALLRAGAVLGREFDVDIARTLVAMSPDDAIAAGEDALLSGLVAERSARQLAFAHGLTQTAVYEGTTRLRRRELHRRAAIALEEAAHVSGEVDAVVVMDIARHWAVVAAGDPAAVPDAARWATRAGDAAVAAADVEEAIARYEQADGFLVAAGGARAEVLVRLGAALASVGRTAEADDRFREALRLADAAGDAPLYARAALGLAGSVRYGEYVDEKIVALTRAIERLGAGDRVLRPSAEAMLMRQLGFDPRPGAYERRQQAAAAVRDALLAPDAPDDLLLALAANRDSIPVGDPALLARLTSRQIELGEQRRDLTVLANAWYGRAWATLELGDVEGWRRATREFGAIASRLRLPYEDARAATMAATTALLEGRYADTDAHADEAYARASSSGDQNAWNVRLTAAVIAAVDRGDAGEVVEVMLAAEADNANIPTFGAGLAMASAIAGRLDVTERLLDAQGRTGFDCVRRDAEWLPVMGLYAYAAGRLRHVEHAAALHALLAAAPERTVRVGPVAGWWGPVAHHLGMLSRVLGRHDDAEAYLCEALEVEAAFDARPFRARTLIELARVEAARPRARMATVGALLDEAASIAAALGAVGIEAEARGVPGAAA